MPPVMTWLCLGNTFSLAVSPLDYWNTFCHLTVKSWTLAGVAFQTNIKWSEMKKKKKWKSWLERRRPNGRYQLLLTRHKSLKTRGHTKSQLVNEGRLVLAVDLNLDACFVGGLICGYSRPSNGTVDASGNLPYGNNAQSQVLVKPVLEAYQWWHTHVFVGQTSYTTCDLLHDVYCTNAGLSGAVVHRKLKTMGRWTHFIKLDVRGGCAGMYQEKMWLNALVYHLV